MTEHQRAHDVAEKVANMNGPATVVEASNGEFRLHAHGLDLPETRWAMKNGFVLAEVTYSGEPGSPVREFRFLRLDRF